MKIDGSRILITGGASGIGYECARHFSSIGAIVAIVDNDRDAIANLPGHFSKEIDERVIFCDVGDSAEVEAMTAEAFDRCGGLDAVINNAAILRDQTLVSRLGKKIKKHSLDDWQMTLSANLTGTFLVAREVAARWLAERRGGVIVNTSSVVRTGNPGQSAYSATKSAIDALTVTWSQELAPYNVRVAAIAFGFAETGLTRDIPAMFLDKLKSRSAAGRFATVGELAHGVQFLLENDYFVGRTLELDGGLRF